MGVITPWPMNAILDDDGNVIGGPEYDAATLRRIFSALLSGGDTPTRARPGVVSGLDVTVVDDTAFIGRGLVVVTTADGSFITGLDAELAVPLGVRHPTNPRRDRVVVQIDNAPTVRDASVRVIEGDPAPNPQPPTLPAGAEPLGVIDVPADGGGPAAFTAGQRYTAARGGIIAVPNQGALGRTPGGSEEVPAFATVEGELFYSAGDDWAPLNAGARHSFFEGENEVFTSLGESPIRVHNVAAIVEEYRESPLKKITLHVRFAGVTWGDGPTETHLGNLVPELRSSRMLAASGIGNRWTSASDSGVGALVSVDADGDLVIRQGYGSGSDTVFNLSMSYLSLGT